MRSYERVVYSALVRTWVCGVELVRTWVGCVELVRTWVGCIEPSHGPLHRLCHRLEQRDTDDPAATQHHGLERRVVQLQRSDNTTNVA